MTRGQPNVARRRRSRRPARLGFEASGSFNLAELTEDPYAAVAGAHAIAVCTEWKQFTELDYAKIYELMQKPAFVFDGRNVLDHQRLFDFGFEVGPIGRVDLTRF